MRYLQSGTERLVHWASLGDLEESRTLVVVEVALERHRDLHLVQPRVVSFAILAIFRIVFVMGQLHLDAFQRPTVPLRIHLKGNRRACAERAEEQFVWFGAGIVAA